jgi:nucleotide-binding universal stress UspA family protein
MKTIVVGYDESEAAARALARAADLAEAFGSKLVVTSVAPVLTGISHGGGTFDPTEPPEEHVRLLDAARAALVGRSADADYQPAVGDPADAILELAEQRQADLIVVGTREPNVIQRLLGQSVSGAVQRRAHCDVLIVH